MPPLDALRAWTLLFIDQVAGKLLILPAMKTVTGGSMHLVEGSRNLIQSAFVSLVKRATPCGDLRSYAEPDDFARVLVGIFHTTGLPGWDPSARRLSTSSSPGNPLGIEQRG